MAQVTQDEVEALEAMLNAAPSISTASTTPAVSTAVTSTTTSTETDSVQHLEEMLNRQAPITTRTDQVAITPIQDLGAPTTALDKQSRVLFDATTGDANGPAMPPRADEAITIVPEFDLPKETRKTQFSTDRKEREDNFIAGAKAANLSREEYISTVVIPSMKEEQKDSPILNWLLDVGGTTTLDGLMGLGDAVGWTSAAFTDGVQSALEGLGEDNPIYKGLNLAESGFGGYYSKAKSPRELAEKVADNVGGFLEFSEILPAMPMGLMSRGFAFTPSALATQDVKATTVAARKLEKSLAGGNKAASAKLAELENAAEKNAANAKIAADNVEILQTLIKEFEARTGKTISITVDGVKKLDGDLARQAGLETAQAVSELQAGTKSVQFNELAGLATGGDTLVEPILKPEKFNAIVALAVDLKKRKPEAFNAVKGANKDKTIIDILFESTVNQDIVGGQELVDMLNKYGLSFEDYVLTVVGSGSEAGKVLNKLSQIARVRPTSEMNAIAAEATNKANGQIRDFVMRVENIRRGGLVSQVATAARNLSSAVIRAPLESLGNVMDTALYNLSNEGLGKAAVSLVSPTNWKDSFRQMKYMFSRPDIAKDYTDLILDRPELAKQFESMFNNVSEIQKMTGRGSGGKVDAVLSGLEDVVSTLNAPNRWQEYLIRRGAFFGELERVTKREWGIDLKEVIDNGKIRDLLNDSSEFKPTKGRSFIDLVDDSTRKALDITYAKQPDIPLFKEWSTFITRNGMTVVVPFPRFMFNSIELMGQYAGGASIPLTRKITQIVTGGKVGAGPLTAKDRQRITRSLLGVAAIGAAYSYRTSEDAPADYKTINADDGTIVDTTAQYPMRQFLYLGEATKRVNDGTFNDWFDPKEFAQTFIGTNIRTGVGNSIIQEVADLATGTDLTKGESAGKLLGGALGNYLSTWVVPFGQIIDAQRVVGERGTEYKESAKDPTLDFMGTFTDQIKKPFKSRGLGLSPQEEAALTNKEYVLTENRERVSPLTKLLFGISMTTANTEEGEYLSDMGFTEMDVSSRSRVPTVRNFENKILREALPTILNAVQGIELDKRAEYQDKTDKFKDSTSEDAYVNTYLKPIITKQLSNVKSKIASGAQSKATPYVMAMSKYRGLTSDLRKWATVRFREQYDRDPDASNTKDLQTLYILGDSYGKAIR